MYKYEMGVITYKIWAFQYKASGVFIILAFRKNNDGGIIERHIYLDEIGKNAFSTREEAETKLKEIKGEN